MAICLIGINHKTAELSVRECFTVAEEDYASVVNHLIKQPTINAAVVISTCNRTEYYLSVDSEKQFLSLSHEYFEFDLEANFIYKKSGAACAAHLFAVAAGVDSLVLGETQIQSQVKKAFDTAIKIATNSEINKLFQMALKTAKLVRSDTEIGKNPVSVAHCAVQLGRQIFGSLDQQRVLIVGAGETAELIIRYLKNHGANQISIANRSLDNAKKLARVFDAEAFSLKIIESHLHEFDLIFSATASKHLLIHHNNAMKALKLRKFRPMVMIDLSVPRDIEEKIKDLDDVFLYAVDDLQKVITENIQRRENNIEDATRIIDAEVELFDQWIKSRRYHGLLKQYQQKVDAVKQTVIDRHTSKNLVDEQANKIKMVAHQVSKKLSHDNISGIRKILESGNDEHIKLIAELFALDLDNDT